MLTRLYAIMKQAGRLDESSEQAIAKAATLKRSKAWTFSTLPQVYPYILCVLLLTHHGDGATISRILLLRSHGEAKFAAAAQGESNMQYLPGWTVQCINQACPARGHWLRAHLSGPNADLEFCPSCGSSLQAVPPPIGPRLRMRPRSLAARPPLRPRPR